MKSVFAVTAIVALAGVANAQMINEFRPNPAGTDPTDTDVELLGTPGAMFDGWILSVESDSSSDTGTVDRATNVSGTFDANGLLVVSVPDFENPSFTLFLTDSFTGAIGDDIDADDDGVAEAFGALGTVLDAIGSPDNAGDEAFLYGAQFGGTDMAFSSLTSEPELVFRDGISLALYGVNDFTSVVVDAAGNEVPLGSFDDQVGAIAGTFGGVNPAVPAPGAAALFGLGGLAMARRRR